jgi:hypothetical protein
MVNLQRLLETRLCRVFRPFSSIAISQAAQPQLAPSVGWSPSIMFIANIVRFPGIVRMHVRRCQVYFISIIARSQALAAPEWQHLALMYDVPMNHMALI